MYQKLIILLAFFIMFFPCCFTRNSLNHTDERIISFDITAFGAKADGSDNAKPILKAWESACSSTGKVTVNVPENKEYILTPVKFHGPCKASEIVFKISGTIKAPKSISDYKNGRNHWIEFENVDNLRVDGGGRFDGNGHVWWENSCKINPKKPCTHAPTAINFVKCNNLRVSDIAVENAQQMHIMIQGCRNVTASHLNLTSPEHSPNTDGIHIAGTSNITVRDCVIGVGDDCISIVSGSVNVKAFGITCGPGHGISIGSLGNDNQSQEFVSNVFVRKATLIGTTNGVRIKTWPGGHGVATNITFQDITMKNVTNPIIIDQNYYDRARPRPTQKSAVAVSNVKYKNIEGTSTRPLAVNLDCSKSIPCQGISMQNVKLVSITQKEVAKASCSNVKVDAQGTVSPRCPSS